MAAPAISASFQSSLLLLHSPSPSKPFLCTIRLSNISRSRSTTAAVCSPVFRISLSSPVRSRGGLVPAVAGPEAAPAPSTADSPSVVIEWEEELGGVGGVGGGGGESFGGGGGGGGGGQGDSGGGDKGESEGGSGKDKKMTGMSMSQKLTLGYAALVGVGGVMGYMKSGSQKSLASGGISALLLYYVYTQLPVRPALASSLGLGLSAALLAVMGSRFKQSGKIFPAGVVSLVSFVMLGGYFHGILRGMHA